MFSFFPAKEKNLCRRFFRVRLPIWGPVRVPVGMSPPSRIPSSIMLRCLRRRRPGSRATCNRCGVYAHVWWLITRVSSGCAVRCFRCLLRWRVLVALIKETGVFVRLRLRLRRDARHRRPPPTPATDARHQRPPPTPARSQDSGRNSRAMPGVVPEFPSKHPRQTAVVLTAKRGRAAFWSASEVTAHACMRCGFRGQAQQMTQETTVVSCVICCAWPLNPHRMHAWAVTWRACGRFVFFFRSTFDQDAINLRSTGVRST